jgi:cytoskeletal protein RodZ
MDEIPLEHKHDEYGRLREPGMSPSGQRNQRKRIKISRRNKKLEPRRRNKWFYATVLVVVGIVLLLFCVLKLIFVSEFSKNDSLEQTGSDKDAENTNSLSPIGSSLVNEIFPKT